MKFILFLLFIIACLGFLSLNILSPIIYQKGYGHIFISDDDASSVLTLLERLRIEALLANNTITKNVTYSQEHLSNLIKSIDDISDSENEFDINSRQFDNSTVNALLFANLIDEVLINYGTSFGIFPSVMTNMSYLSSSLINTVDKSDSIIDSDKYMMSQEYAKRSWEIYNFDLRIFETNDNKNSLRILGKSLMNLVSLIDNKTDPLKIMGIVHTEIHPNLQAAFNLTLKP